MMRLPKDVFGLWSVGLQTAQMMAEAQTVMALRLMGMAGVWATAPTEGVRMVFEKPDAFIRSASSATEAALAGKRPDQIAEAAIKPLRRKTRANARRLAKKGPKVPGRPKR